MIPDQNTAPTSTLAECFTRREAQWRALLKQHFPGARLLRWGTEHRVYRVQSRVMKVEFSTFGKRSTLESLHYEYQMLKKLEGSASKLNPQFYTLDDKWDVLEMDWVEGAYLQDLFDEGKPCPVSLWTILYKLFRVSMAGIIYKQLRARHIIVTPQHDVAFIDFGNSKQTSVIDALRNNFAVLSRKEGQWKVGRTSAFCYEILRRRKRRSVDFSATEQTIRQQALARWKMNQSRQAEALPEYLKTSPGDLVAADNFAEMERKMFAAVSQDPKIAEDAIQFTLNEYGMTALRDWGFIWDHIMQHVDFTDKSVIDIGSGMGGISAFAPLAGAKHIICYEDNETLLEAGRAYAQALGVVTNDYQHISWTDLFRDEHALPPSDVACALSTRLEDYPRERLLDLLQSYAEVLILSRNPEDDRGKLKERGFHSVTPLVKVDRLRQVVYAKR